MGARSAAIAEQCGACRSRDVAIDVVEAGPGVESEGWLWLGECRHCDHRWTLRGAAPLPLPPRGVVRVVAGAQAVASAA